MLGRIIFAAYLIAISCYVIASPPDKSAPKKPLEPPKGIPDIALALNESNWGIVHLDRSTGVIQFTNHPQWVAEGRVKIHADGKVTLTMVWTLIATGRLAPSFYDWDDENKEFRGVWNYDDAVTVRGDGTLAGPTNTDRIHQKKP